VVIGKLNPEAEVRAAMRIDQAAVANARNAAVITEFPYSATTLAYPGPCWGLE
jgi:hypothetical protein